ncbi:MAG: hypothetical protein R2685_14290 [Candidatus Nitrosocosmicus sp.]|nr:hypothetical protein [Candidatus Nitrosocosmicus sp.]
MYIFQISEKWDRSIKLSDSTTKMLLNFATGNVLSIWRCHKLILEDYKKFNKKISYKNVYKKAMQLESLGLIKRVFPSDGKPTIRGAINLKITSLGIFYIFKNKLYYQGLDLIGGLESDGLYETFLYPCIEKKLVLRIHDSYLMSRIFNYLSKCCNLMEQKFETFQSIENEGNICLSIATTRSIMDKDLSDVESVGLKGFTNYLSDRFKLKWLKSEKNKIKIERSCQNKFVISKGRNKISITLYTQKSVALVSHMNLNIGEIQIEKVSDDDTDNEYLFVENKAITVEEYWNNKNYYIHRELKRLSLEFTNDILDYCCTEFNISIKELKSKDDALKILKSSPNFMKLLKEMVGKINDQHNYFISSQ